MYSRCPYGGVKFIDLIFCEYGGAFYIAPAVLIRPVRSFSVESFWVYVFVHGGDSIPEF